jgi:anaerobic magnesium-protoporphyrin IX monomethyl ester cyclase
MNILFIYSIRNAMLREKPLKGQEDIQLGIAQLSAVLKQEGHHTGLLVLDRKYGKKNLVRLVRKMHYGRFDLVCFSSVFSEFAFIREVASYVKHHFQAFTLLGGSHVTVSPHTSYLDTFDALCIGEGEEALAELARGLEKGRDISRIRNLWVKQDGQVIRNPSRPFLQDLDALPLADRELFQEQIFEPESRISVLLGRGCPYQCTYCCNHKIREVAGGKYVRMRSVPGIVEELESLTRRFPGVREYFLEVETLGAHMKWLEELCRGLEQFNRGRDQALRFSANLRVFDRMDHERIFSQLSGAGFDSVSIGLESGSERIRKEVLDRHYSNKTIRLAVHTARKFGLKVGMFNLIGLPTESFDDYLETLRLNQELQPDWHATSIFFPYPGTRLHALSEELGLIREPLAGMEERQHAVLDLPGFSRRQIQREFDRFHFKVHQKSGSGSPLKYALYAMQIFLGHGCMTRAKNKLTVFLHRMGINHKLLNIIQKT